jgi:hypothetical protein
MGICVGRMDVWILRRLGIVISMFQTVHQHTPCGRNTRWTDVDDE